MYLRDSLNVYILNFITKLTTLLLIRNSRVFKIVLFFTEGFNVKSATVSTVYHKTQNKFLLLNNKDIQHIYYPLQ